MKKAVVGFALSVFIFAGAAWAMTPDEVRQQKRQEMKLIKQAMREKRQSEPKVAKAPSKMDLFWKKEGERSGLGGSGSSVGGFVKNLNPMPFFKNQNEQYRARKAAGQVK